MPLSLDYSLGRSHRSADLHALDPANVYTLDRSWAIGSCPHAFLRLPEGLVYLGELFAREPRVWQRESVELPERSLGLEVAELEDEITIISFGGSGDPSPIVLQKGMSVVFKRPKGGTLTLHGAYFPLGRSLEQPEPMIRNDLVRDWLRG